MSTTTIIILISAVAVVLLIVCIVMLVKLAGANAKALTRSDLDRIEQVVEQSRKEILDASRQSDSELRLELSNENSKNRAEQNENMQGLRTEIGSSLAAQAIQNEQKLENIRNTMEMRIRAMQDDNAKQLDLMRSTVDEKLQKTLEDRIGQSFKQVTTQLEQVYKGLGEMQNLAAGVGDLKKVLSNVKNRGIMGEIQLEAILEDILSPDRYEKNFATVKGSSNRVEFAVKLPGQGEDPVYLPIDAKFPADKYAALMDAYDSGDIATIDICGKELENMIKVSAKDIRDKYIQPPDTTEFGIMFLPTEGLYAEVVRRGLVDKLQHDYKINIAGPTTMGAMLNSLQMGFRTLAIQKRSGEVWNVLGAVKTEFEKFDNVLRSYQKRMNTANEELDNLIGAKSKKIVNKLKNIEALSDEDSEKILSLNNTHIDED